MPCPNLPGVMLYFHSIIFVRNFFWLIMVAIIEHFSWELRSGSIHFYGKFDCCQSKVLVQSSFIWYITQSVSTIYTLYEPQTSFISEMRKLKTFFLQKILKLQELLSSILCQVLKWKSFWLFFQPGEYDKTAV